MWDAECASAASEASYPGAALGPFWSRRRRSDRCVPARPDLARPDLARSVLVRRSSRSQRALQDPQKTSGDRAVSQPLAPMPATGLAAAVAAAVAAAHLQASAASLACDLAPVGLGESAAPGCLWSLGEGASATSTSAATGVRTWAPVAEVTAGRRRALWSRRNSRNPRVRVRMRMRVLARRRGFAGVGCASWRLRWQIGSGRPSCGRTCTCQRPR